MKVCAVMYFSEWPGILFAAYLKCMISNITLETAFKNIVVKGKSG